MESEHCGTWIAKSSIQTHFEEMFIREMPDSIASNENSFAVKNERKIE